jgi:hypothetical protein
VGLIPEGFNAAMISRVVSVLIHNEPHLSQIRESHAYCDLKSDFYARTSLVHCWWLRSSQIELFQSVSGIAEREHTQ